MYKDPSAFRESLVSKRQLKDLFGVGLLLSLGVFSSYTWGVTFSPEVGQTMAFTTLVLLIFVQLFVVRAEFELSFFSNPLVLSSVGLSLLLQVMLIYVPLFQELFHTVPLEAIHWGVMLGVTVITWMIYFCSKRIFSRG
jgi:Ca2+-transporting ATPase